jgi:hypothetical protein
VVSGDLNNFATTLDAALYGLENMTSLCTTLSPVGGSLVPPSILEHLQAAKVAVVQVPANLVGSALDAAAALVKAANGG